MNILKGFSIVLLSLTLVGCIIVAEKNEYIFINESSKMLIITHDKDTFYDFLIAPKSRKKIYIDQDMLFFDDISAFIKDDPEKEAYIESGDKDNEIVLYYNELDEEINLRLSNPLKYLYLTEEEYLLFNPITFEDYTINEQTPSYYSITVKGFSSPYVGTKYGRQALLREDFKLEMDFLLEDKGGWNIFSIITSRSTALIEYL